MMSTLNVHVSDSTTPPSRLRVGRRSKHNMLRSRNHPRVFHPWPLISLGKSLRCQGAALCKPTYRLHACFTFTKRKSPQAIPPFDSLLNRAQGIHSRIIVYCKYSPIMYTSHTSLPIILSMRLRPCHTSPSRPSLRIQLILNRRRCDSFKLIK